MFDATLRSEAPTNATLGRAELVLKAEDGRTGIARLDHREPLRFLFPRARSGDPFTAALTNTGGGLVGGDRLSISIRAEARARALVMAQAAEKVYRTAGPEVTVSVDLAAEDGAWLEWLPQETIVFDQARLRRRTRLDVSAGGRILAGEILVLGRQHHGENVCSGLIRDAWDVYSDGRLMWADALHLDGDIAAKLAHPVGFDGRRALATLVLVGADDAMLEQCQEALRELQADADTRFGVSRVGGLLVARWLAMDGQAARAGFARGWSALRRVAAGLPGALPRLWQV